MTESNVLTASDTGAETRAQREAEEVLTYEALQALSLVDKRKVFEYFDAKLPNGKDLKRATGKQIDAAFAEAEIDDSMYEGIYMQDPAGGLVVVSDAGEPAVTEMVVVEDIVPESVEAVEKILVKMTRPNYHFEVQDYTFTREHPYALVPVPVAEWIIRNVEGFVQALPSELEEYYE